MRIAIAIGLLGIASAAHGGGAAVNAKVACGLAIESTGDPPDESNSTEILACEVTLARLPRGNVVATFLRTPPAAPADAPIAMAVADDGGTFGASAALSPAPSPDCTPVRIDAAVTVDGRRAWSGHTTYAPQCHYTPPHLACTTDDGTPLAPHARLDRDVTCTISGDAIGRAYVTATVTRPVDAQPIVRDEARGVFAADGDLLACAATVFRGEIDRDEHPVWSQAIAVRPLCPRPRARWEAALPPDRDRRRRWRWRWRRRPRRRRRCPSELHLPPRPRARTVGAAARVVHE